MRFKLWLEKQEMSGNFSSGRDIIWHYMNPKGPSRDAILRVAQENGDGSLSTLANILDKQIVGNNKVNDFVQGMEYEIRQHAPVQSSPTGLSQFMRPPTPPTPNRPIGWGINKEKLAARQAARQAASAPVTPPPPVEPPATSMWDNDDHDFSRVTPSVFAHTARGGRRVIRSPRGLS